MSDVRQQKPTMALTDVLSDAERKVSALGSGVLESALLVIGWVLAGASCLVGLVFIVSGLFEGGGTAWVQYAIGVGCIAGGFLVALPYFIASQALRYLRSIAIVQVLTVD